MEYERQIIEWKPEELKDAGRFFTRLTNMDPESPNPKYGTSVKEALDLVSELTSVKAVYKRLDIEDRGDGSVQLAGGQTIKGKMPAKVLEKANDMVTFVVTLDGFEKVKSSDVMIAYFADTWGSALVECAQAKLGDLISVLAGSEGKKRTHMWCPGQHTFELSNQTAIFDILHPEDIGCRLTPRLMMVPVKSASGIMGIVPESTTDMPKPCDYCQFRKTCPASMNGCAVL